MRTDSPESFPPAVARVRETLARIWQRVAAFGLLTRLALLAALVGMIATTGYFLSPDDPGGLDWIYDEHHFSREEVAQISKVLDTEGIAWASDKGRIQVKRQRLTDVQAILDRKGLAPLDFRGIRGQALPVGILEAPADLAARRNRQREEQLEQAIEDIDPSLMADVQIVRERTRGLKPVEDVKISVRLTAEGDRRIASETITAIETLLCTFEPKLKPDGLAIIDRKAREYRSPKNSVVNQNFRARGREEELSTKIREQLDWIRGIRVSVSIDPLSGASEVETPVLHDEVPPEITVNQPVEELPVPEPMGIEPLGKAKVFVQIPASHVVERFRAVSPERKPTPMDLEPFFTEARERVEKVVRNVVPTAEFGNLEVSRIDVTGALTAVTPGTESSPRGRPNWWVTAVSGAGSAAAVIALAFGFWLLTRRPSARPATEVRRRRIVTRPSAGPAERVRELVRLDPAAAAGVLHRWIGQGGHGA